MKLSSLLTTEEFEKAFRDERWREAARIVCGRHGLSFERLTRAEHGENIVFLVDESYVIKIYTPFRRGFERERAALLFAGGKTSLPVPEILFEGELERFKYLVITQKKGRLMTRADWLDLETKEQIRIVRELARGLGELHGRDAGEISFDWKGFIERQARTALERQRAGGASADWLEKIPVFLEANLSLLEQTGPDAFLHGDVHFGNLRMAEAGAGRRISALFDFADSLKGFFEYDFVAVGVLMIQGQAEIQKEFFRAYGYAESDLDETLRRRLMLLTILYECSNLRKYALRLRPEAARYTLEELERAIWCF